MRIGILNPSWGFLTGDITMHQWAEVFMNKYKPDILTLEQAKQYDGDVIVCFNGRPDIPNNCPPKEFKGLKIAHVMDHSFRAKDALKMLLDNEVDYLLGYNKHDDHDPFFREVYAPFNGKIIGVPFGFHAERFQNIIPFKERKNKVIALGSVNPVKDPFCLEDIQDFANFFREEEFTHKWRRTLVTQKNFLVDQMDSLLPEYPETKNFSYNIAEVYNQYQMFTSCESIMNYPSVKTFEGMACGSVLVCPDTACFRELGLVHGENCLMHKPHDLLAFKKLVAYWQDSPEALERISQKGVEFVRANYSPSRVAEDLYYSILDLCGKNI